MAMAMIVIGGTSITAAAALLHVLPGLQAGGRRRRQRHRNRSRHDWMEQVAERRHAEPDVHAAARNALRREWCR
jgi:hypothetical protein